MGNEQNGTPPPESYNVINNMNYELVSPGWTAHEELLLLDGLAKFGFGNWADVSSQVATKSSQECEAHYMGVGLLLTSVLV
jgi:hypothetical protein